MAELIQAIVLGIVQGISEFVPISSSGHLVITPWFFGWEKPSLLFDTILHWGTLVSILMVFWRDFWNITVAVIRGLMQRSLADFNARLGWFIVLGSIPAAVIGLSFKGFFEALFFSPQSVGFFLLVTGTLLLGSEWLARRMAERKRPLTAMTLRDTIIIGFGQALALAPGISRSGSTIAAGLIAGLNRETAARFSFLLGTPAFFGAGLLELIDAMAEDQANVAAQLPELIVGFVVSAVVGYISIRFLLAYLRTHSLNVFAYYCYGMGLFVIVLSFLGYNAQF
jgi:undecaprenyl-diphosphatase